MEELTGFTIASLCSCGSFSSIFRGSTVDWFQTTRVSGLQCIVRNQFHSWFPPPISSSASPIFLFFLNVYFLVDGVKFSITPLPTPSGKPSQGSPPPPLSLFSGNKQDLLSSPPLLSPLPPTNRNTRVRHTMNLLKMPISMGIVLFKRNRKTEGGGGYFHEEKQGGWTLSEQCSQNLQKGDQKEMIFCLKRRLKAAQFWTKWRPRYNVLKE